MRISDWSSDVCSSDLLLDEAGFAGSPTDYLEQVKRDPRWRASGAEEVGAVFQRYIDRIAPHVEARFNFKPKADHGAAPLPDAPTKSMTFGFSSAPTPHRAERRVGKDGVSPCRSRGAP